MTTATAVKLNLGCGATRIIGYMNVDSHHFAADMKADMAKLPYEDGTVDEIYTAHALEHIPFAETAAVLAEWLRVLKPGGQLRVVVPNMDWVASAWLHGSDRSYARQVMFGNQQHEGEFHQNGWSKADLIQDVEQAGFHVKDCVARWTAEYSQESIILEAEKWQ